MHSRTVVLRLLVAHWRHGQPIDEALKDMFDSCVLRLKDEDEQELKNLLGEMLPSNFEELFEQFKRTAAHNVEAHDIPHGL